MSARLRFACACLASGAALALAAGCGGDPPAKKPAKPPKDAGTGKRAKADTPDTPAKPPEVRSKSGKTPHELMNLLGDSYKQMDAAQSPAELLAAATQRAGWVAEAIECGAGALPHVLDALKHPVGEVREWSCVILGEIGQSEAAEALLALALDDRDRNIAIYACDALGRLKDVAGAMERLKPRLAVESFQKGHPIWDTQAGLLRNAAAEALTRHGNKDGVPALVAAIEGPSAEVRRDALIRLRRVTAQEFPTTVDGPADERARTLALWRHWWDEAKGLFKPAVSEAPKIHQVYARGEKK